MSDTSRKILGTVVCLPVRDLDASRAFYAEVFDLPDLSVEEGMITVELPNLSLFLIEEAAFESYSRKTGRGVNYPTSSSDVILSCAIASQKGLDDILYAAADNGGTVATRGTADHETGLYVGYFFDPDGHHWELAYSGR
jgi:predicted lactoylglutathione lyase